MKKNDITQLELDFSVIKDGTKVRVKGYDCHHLLDLTDIIGVVDSYCQRTGDYFIYFKGMRGIVPNTRLILIYRREQLQVIPGRRGRCSWERLVKKKSN
ncbi:hypothetical protein H6G33_25130 [Calothrix sp. FACHB-1219]|uniref:hypothetical protein n=1 Tax=unclassified Calothrix TaxID=2619626 RepID=UPI000B5EAF3D|nr:MULTISPECIES: hypothetical protein [unclassified Calothrix]MBD2205630.1 hypothetical protein [Calothrix sp. FACHB-168]MBD2220293.1 hypothetical protein [Calothrix sp. FACHB-1219]BAY67003.1 hypothetical protein NIES22_71470 [Calothrix brevissima NIES-22]